MRNIRIKVLAVAIGASVCGAAWLPALAQAPQGAEAGAARSYIIEFDEPGLFDSAVGQAQRKVGVAKARPTSVDAGRIDVKAKESVDYLTQVEMQQATHLSAIRAAIGRSSLKVTHYYNITLSGVSAELTEAEAALVAAVPGVKSIEPTQYYKKDTFRGPTYIGANTIWDGSAVRGGVGNRGEGQVLASLDGGTNSTHPSFADDASCGFGALNHKLKSKLDCTSTGTGGTCNGTNPEDEEDGHGVHTSSTAAGNVVSLSSDPTLPVVAPYSQISGVAPCAAIRAYKMCDSNVCGGNATLAAINNFMAAGDVTAVNYSVGPTTGGLSSTNPWSSGNDKEFLPAVQSGIFVAASAGNTSATVTNPSTKVAHMGPWMMTVAASSQDEVMSPGVTITGPGSPPPLTQGVYLVPGNTTPLITSAINADILTYPTNIAGCTNAVAADPNIPDSGTPGGGFPANYFAGKIALVKRGDCNFTEKVDNAYTAGAVAVIIYNNVLNFGTLSMALDGATTPSPKAWFIEGQFGRAMRDYIAANPPTAARIDPVSFGHRQGDVLGDFSLRGPAAGVPDITKPDITGPGVDILAAKNPTNFNYGLMSGTSMSSPHIAGAGMLMMAAHPTWTPAEVKSAMMLTAGTGFRENGTTPWTPDDVGSGRVHLERAVRAGFVMDISSYFATNTTRPSAADQRSMNFASMRNTTCSKASGCTWTRTVRDTLGTPTTWTATVQGPTDIALTVTPSTFSFNGDRIFRDGFDASSAFDTQALTIRAQPGASVPVSTSTWYFGTVTFTEANNLAPPATMTVAIKVSN